jgi:hypothetical protein
MKQERSKAARERRDIVTPYAFTVHPALLGLPLAHPWQRAAAIAVDGVAVGFLSQVPDALLAIVTGIVMFRWTGRAQHPKAVRWRTWLRVFAVLLFLGGVAGLAIGRQELRSGEFAGIQIEVRDSAADKSAPVVAEKPRTADAESRAHSLIEWGKGLLDDLGIGIGWAALYFTVFSAWWNGQTPGKKLLGIRVVQLDGTPITLWEAFERYGGYAAGLATGLLGYAQVWWDPNRQAIQDKIAETVVIRASAPGSGPGAQPG